MINLALDKPQEQEDAVIKEIIYKMDLEKLKRIKGENCLHKNDIARIKIKTTTPFFFDAYRKKIEIQVLSF